MSERGQAALPALLQKAGYRIRGRRADCLRCQAEGHGRGRSTISFTDEVAFCHRCKWTGNIRTLSRQLGVAVGPERSEDVEKRKRVAEFEEWKNTCYRILARRLQILTCRAELSKRILRYFPDCEPAWGALADYYHNEAELFGALDVLAFEKCSQWLDVAMKPETLFAAFAEAEGRVDRAA